MTAIANSLIAVSVTAAAYLIYKHIQDQRKAPLPPGPKPLPLLGNVNDFPPKDVLEHVHWLKHKERYGAISSLTVLGSTIVLIHDSHLARELLESVKTTGRPRLTMATELCGYKELILWHDPTATFRKYRKLLHQELGQPEAAAQYRELQEQDVKRQLVRSLREPKQWVDHFKTNIAAGVLKMTYGYNIEPHKPDVLIHVVDRVTEEFSHAVNPMAWMVDIFPILRFVPEGIPGTGFKKTARLYKKNLHTLANVPYSFVRQQMANQTHRPSYVSRLVKALSSDGGGSLAAEDEEAIKWTAASMYGAAVDTTAYTLTAFTLAMAKFPEVQRKAQEEIDRVVGKGRLPALADRENLPYLRATVKEAIRWWPVAPMGVPHKAMEDIECRGYRIPKNALIIPATWSFLHDPEVYADPEAFEPDRFIAPRDEPDPKLHAFGYGRRKCAGQSFAENTLFINIASTLATYNVKPPIGEDGQPVAVSGGQPVAGVLMRPSTFNFRVEPRSAEHRELIERFEKEYPFEAGDGELLGGIDDS